MFVSKWVKMIKFCYNCIEGIKGILSMSLPSSLEVWSSSYIQFSDATLRMGNLIVAHLASSTRDSTTWGDASRVVLTIHDVLEALESRKDL